MLSLYNWVPSSDTNCKTVRRGSIWLWYY